MKIRRLILQTALVLISGCALAEETPSATFSLRFDDLNGSPKQQQQILKCPFYLIVQDGVAFLAQDENTKADAQKLRGTIDLIVRTGIDPLTKKPREPILQIVFHYSGSGWAADRFETEIVIPYTFAPEDMLPTGAVHRKVRAIISDQAFIVMTWRNGKYRDINFVYDPMNVRLTNTLKCTTINSGLRIGL